jgi:hypothetical protein
MSKANAFVSRASVQQKAFNAGGYITVAGGEGMCEADFCRRDHDKYLAAARTRAPHLVNPVSLIFSGVPCQRRVFRHSLCRANQPLVRVDEQGLLLFGTTELTSLSVSRLCRTLSKRVVLSRVLNGEPDQQRRPKLSNFGLKTLVAGTRDVSLIRGTPPAVG